MAKIKQSGLDIFKRELKADYLTAKIDLEEAIKRLIKVGFTDHDAYNYLKG